MVHIHGARAVDPNGLRTGDEPHQVEEMAALFDHCPTGVRGEPVPVAHLPQKWEAVLANRQHLQPSDPAAVYLADERLGRRHVTVLHRRPERGCGALGLLDDPARVLERRGQRFLAENRQSGLEHRFQHLSVRVVRTGDDDAIHKAAAGQFGPRLKGGDEISLRTQRFAGRAQRSFDGIGDCGHHRARRHGEVVDVLHAHHADTDQAVADRLGQLSLQRI